jgi:hypothetical protein
MSHRLTSDRHWGSAKELDRTLLRASQKVPPFRSSTGHTISRNDAWCQHFTPSQSRQRSIDWLIIYSFTSHSRIFSLLWRSHHCLWRASKFEPMFSTQSLGLESRSLYHATPVVTRGLCFPGVIWRTASFSRLLRHTRGCTGSILTRILTKRSVRQSKSQLELSLWD